MKSLLNYSSQNRNIGLLLYNDKQKSIEGVRKSLFASLNRYHPSIAFAVQKLLTDRMKKCSLPLLGEIFPHILNEFISDIDPEIFKEVSAQWLAAYVLTTMIDNNYDNGIAIDGRLVAPLCMETSKLQKRVIGTIYSDLFEELVFESIHGQIRDVKLQKVRGNLKAKLESAKDKNKIFSALTVVLAAITSNPQRDSVMAFTDNFLLSFQLLDDLADLHSDFLNGNNTVLLSKLNNIDSITTKHLLLHEVIMSGTMLQTLKTILMSFNKGIKMVENNMQVNRNGALFLYFSSMTTQVGGLKKLCFKYNYSSEIEGKKALELIDKRIKIVCQST